MKYTLLGLTQRILSAMESDEVNSISDTVESQAVADIIEECFWEITSTLDLPEHFDFFELEASGDSTKPILMTRPTDVLSLDTIHYDNIDTILSETNPRYVPVKYLEVPFFMSMIDGYDTDEDNVDTFDMTIDGDSISIKYYNDRFPTWYTTFDDRTILFESFRLDIENTLQKDKTRCYGMITPTFTQSDAFTPDLDPRQIMLLLNQAKAQCFIELKQVENVDAERKSRRARISTQKKKHDINYPKSYRDTLANYGRNSRRPYS